MTRDVVQIILVIMESYRPTIWQ